MEDIKSDSNKASINKVNILLSPERHYRKQVKLLPCLPKRSKSNKKSQSALKNHDTYSVAYIGDRKGKLDISVKRFSIPRLSPKQISKKYHATSTNSNNIQTICSHIIHKYFRPKALTPTNFKGSDSNEKTRGNLAKLNRWK